MRSNVEFVKLHIESIPLIPLLDCEDLMKQRYVHGKCEIWSLWPAHIFTIQSYILIELSHSIVGRKYATVYIGERNMLKAKN